MGNWYDCVLECLVDKKCRDMQREVERKREEKTLAKREEARAKKREKLINILKKDF